MKKDATVKREINKKAKRLLAITKKLHLTNKRINNIGMISSEPHQINIPKKKKMTNLKNEQSFVDEEKIILKSFLEITTQYIAWVLTPE